MAEAKKADATSAKGDVQKQMDKIQDQGYLGVTSDPTPDSAYALPNPGDGTPERDADAKAAADKHQREM